MRLWPGAKKSRQHFSTIIVLGTSYRMETLERLHLSWVMGKPWCDPTEAYFEMEEELHHHCSEP